MTARLGITGANSDSWGVRDVAIPDSIYPTFEEAVQMAEVVQYHLVLDGYHRTAAGIYIKGSWWVRTGVIEDGTNGRKFQ
jgi:hypothetical protein